MKTSRLFATVSGIAAIAGLVLLNGCGKSAAPPPAEFQSSSTKSAEPNSFNEVAAHLDAGGNLYLYLSTEEWLNGLSDKISKWRGLFESAPMNSDEHEDVMRAFDLVTRVVRDSGVEDISGFGLSSIAVEKGFYRIRAVLHHYQGKGSGFVWSIFGNSSHALNGLDMAPATTAFAMFSDLNVEQLWSVVQDETKHSGFPEAEQFLRQMPAQFKRATGLDWDKVIASLGGEFGVILTMDESKMVPIPLPTSEQVQIPEPGLLIVAKANDDVIFKRLEQLMSQSGQQPIRSDQDGAQMRTIAVPPLLPIELRPTIALADGYLFIASNDSLVEEALAVKRGKKAGLKTTDEFKRLAKDIPSQGNQFTYVSQRFGQNLMKVQQQVMEMQAARQPGMAEFVKSFINPANAQYSFCVGANTDEGWMSVGNGNQNAAVMVAVVPVAVVGMLSAIAVPNFVKARTTAQKNACINNLRQIDGAKEQWALENNKKTGTPVTESDIAPFLRGGFPVCPQGGHYTIGPVGTTPRCSIPGHSLSY